MSDFLKVYGDCTGAFGFPMFEEDARSLDKMLSENSEYEISHFKKFKAKHPSDHFISGERADVSVVTDDSVDIEKEVVLPDSINWDTFRKRGGIVNFGHNYKQPPIGKSLWQKKVGNVWRAKTVYASRPEKHPEKLEWFPDSVFHMIKSGFLPGKSISGVSKTREITKDDLKINETWAGAEKIRYDTIIYEYSVVPFQANTHAIVESVAKGLVAIPDDILHISFPEVEEMVRDIKETVKAIDKLPVDDIIIKEYKTSGQYRDNLEMRLQRELQMTVDRMPELVEDILSRLLGRV